MRAISDEAVKALVNSGICTDTDADREYVCECIDNIPTIETKQGEWMPHKRHNGETVLWKCSECGHTIYSETKTDRLAYHKWCGKCGADMRGSEKE